MKGGGRTSRDGSGELRGDSGVTPPKSPSLSGSPFLSVSLNGDDNPVPACQEARWCRRALKAAENGNTVIIIIFTRRRSQSVAPW